ncbi:hypothetical protein [Streptomyces rimosus]
MNKNPLRIAAAAVGAAVFLGITGPMASATEADHARISMEHTAVVQLADAAEAAQIKEDRLDQRLAALPHDRTTDQVVAAMYPAEPAAQREVLNHLGGGVQTRGFWGSAWKYTKCVAAVGAASIPATKAYKAIKGLGGVAEAAKLMIKAGSAAEFKKAAGNAALNILGISAIQNNCF